MKKILTLLVAGMMLLGLAACGGTPTPTETTKATDAPVAAKTVKVGVSIYQFDDNFMTLYRNEIQTYFDSLSNDQVKYEVTIQDGKNDQAEQSNQIDTFIANKMDVLIINLVQSTSAATIIEKCETANVPCIFINREPSEEDMKLNPGKIAYVGADARQSGRFMGEILAELPNKADLNGDGKMSYVMLMGDPENDDAQYRTQYSIEQYIESSGLQVEKLVEERGEWKQEKGQEITANALAKYGDKVEVIISNNDAMGLGAIQAIEAAGRVVGEDIYIVSVDALDEVKGLVEEGKYTGTVLNDHINQSHNAVDAAIKAVNGETLNTYYWVNYVKVTK